MRRKRDVVVDVFRRGEVPLFLRFQPILLTAEDLEMPHGLNERLSVANFERMIRFYVGLMEAGAMQ
jgi:hypothetical protein